MKTIDAAKRTKYAGYRSFQYLEPGADYREFKLSKELARKGITANAVAPGVIQTTMIGDIKPDVLEGYIKQIPLGRLGDANEIVNAILFLASPMASYITGHVLNVNGGYYMG